MNLLRVGSVASLALLASVTAVSGEETPVPKDRTFTFTYRLKFPVPEGAKRVDAWVPLPIEDEHQEVTDLKVEASAPHEEGKDATYGNRMLHVGVDSPKGEVVLGWTATIARKVDAGEGKAAVVARFKEADQLVPIDGKASDLAKELGVDAAGDAKVRAQKIYDSVVTTMTYDKVEPGWGKGDFDRACAVGKGNCTDFHALIIGMARSVGIPARFAIGLPLPEARGSGEIAGYHCWAELYIDGKGWVPVDSSEAAKHPAKKDYFYGHHDDGENFFLLGQRNAPWDFNQEVVFDMYETNGGRWTDLDPALVSRFIALPKMRERPYRIALDRAGTATAALPREPGRVTLLHLQGLRVTQLQTGGAVELQQAVAGACLR